MDADQIPILVSETEALNDKLESAYRRGFQQALGLMVIMFTEEPPDDPLDFLCRASQIARELRTSGEPCYMAHEVRKRLSPST